MDTRQKRPASASTARRTSQSTAKRSAAARSATASGRKPKKKNTTRVTSADVVYTPPKPINRTKVLLGLAATVAVVLALIFSLSLFFRVDNIVVSGAQKYDAWTVKEASGIEIGDNLLGVSEPRVAGKIQGALSYVDEVRVGIKLPDTVNIEIKELDVWYAVRDAYNAWWLMTSEGRIVEQVDAATAGECTQILGIQLAAPVVGQVAVATEAAASVDENGVTVPVTITNAERLAAALDIVQTLEKYSVIGSILSVDVTYMSMIELWYGQQQYQINLGDTSQLDYKVYCMKEAIDALPEYEAGQIDVSFTVITDQPVYKSFDS